jgi:2-polyprenyl-6-methoxyphenol hydroxylase-like FAD-dependent oxidoreductase
VTGAEAPQFRLDDGDLVTCDFVLGCDGFHGVARPALAGVSCSGVGFDAEWLALLAQAPLRRAITLSTPCTPTALPGTCCGVRRFRGSTCKPSGAAKQRLGTRRAFGTSSVSAWPPKASSPPAGPSSREALSNSTAT